MYCMTWVVVLCCVACGHVVGFGLLVVFFAMRRVVLLFGFLTRDLGFARWSCVDEMLVLRFYVWF